MVKVFIVDDQVIVRRGLQALVEYVEGIEIIGESGSGEEALVKIPNARPDIVLLDIRMPKLDGIEVLHALKRSGVDIPVIMLTTFDDHRLILKAVKAGAKGYLLKDTDIEDLVKVINSVLHGASAITPLSASRLEEANSLSALPRPPEFAEKLTRKETEILRLIASGFNNKEISEVLFKSEGTVKNHVTNIMSKLGTRDRTQTALYAISRKLL